MRRLLAVVLVCALLVPSAAAVPDARLAVTDVTVAPETPVVGEPVTVTATVRESAGSPSPVELSAVRLVSGETTLAAATNPGSLSPGETLSLDLTHAFASAGTKDLAVVAVGEDADGERVEVRRPLTVVVEQAAPQLEVTVDRAVARTENRVQVQLSNPNTAQYRNLTVRLDAPGAVEDRRTVPVVAGGATVVRNLSFAPQRAGDVQVRVVTSYATDTGVPRQTSYVETVTVDPLREDVGVAVRPAAPPAQAAAGGTLQGLLGGGGTLQQRGQQSDGEGAPDAVTVEVTNFGNAPLREAVVHPSAGDRALPRAFVGRLAPGESATVEVDLAAVRSPANVTARVEYATGDRTGSAVGAFDYQPPVGAVRLTGVSLTRDGDTLRIAGNAGNVGDGEVTGLVVAVGESEFVAPAYPQRDYFIGTVEGSEFAPFELTADADVANATTVPVEVTYRSDGVERTETVELPMDRSLAEGEDGNRNGLALGVVAVLGVALLAGGIAVVVGRYR
ncbi:CARDB domain-containing protein [Halorarius litoreus]|uniref:CARDB domain-containing protein n=1 Tax=Halorarius litoreus TaxID=2962676 RepID=UPI0020CF9E0D|nr:CARDB domain-containing protein [Halorarius litoreus]